MKKLNVALIGYGMSAQVFHAPFLEMHPYLNLHTILERNKQESKERYPNAIIEKDYKKILANKEIDLVVITTPNHVHYEQTYKALEAGKHVVVEKPFVTNSIEGRDLIEFAKEENLKLSVFQNRRYDGDFLTVKKMIDNDDFGSIYEFESRFDRFRDYLKGWKELKGVGTGILYDLGSHLIDQAFQLFGEDLVLKHSELKIQREVGEAIDYFEIHLNKGNTKITLKANMTSCYSPRFKIYGSKGTYEKRGFDPQEELLKEHGVNYLKSLTNQKESAHFYKPDNLVEQLPVDQGKYDQFYNEMYEAITFNKNVPVDPEQAVKVIEMIEQIIYQNADKKKNTKRKGYGRVLLETA